MLLVYLIFFYFINEFVLVAESIVRGFVNGIKALLESDEKKNA